MDTIYSSRMGGTTNDLLKAYAPANPMLTRPAAASAVQPNRLPINGSPWDAQNNTNQYMQQSINQIQQQGIPQAQQAQQPTPYGSIGDALLSNTALGQYAGVDRLNRRVMDLQADLAGINPQNNPQQVDPIGTDMAPEGYQPDPYAGNIDQGDVGPGFGYDKPPSMPTDPTNGQNKFTEDHVNAGVQGIGLAMGGRQPTNPIQAQTMAGDQQRMNQDLTNIAAAKDPKKAWQDMKKDPFYKDSSFYSGVMATGLAIMSGANPLQAFQAGQGQMEKADIKNQLSENREALMQMYTPDSVAAAISSGDQSKLQQKKMSEEDRMAAENQIWQQRADYGQRQQEGAEQRAEARWGRQNAVTSAQADARFNQQQAIADSRFKQQQAAMDARQQASFDRQKQMLDLRGQQKLDLASRQASSLNFDSKLRNSEMRNAEFGNVTKWVEKGGLFEAADNELKQALSAKAGGDDQTARAMMQQAVFNMIRGEKGGTASIQPEDFKHMGLDPSLFVQKGNEWSLKAGFAPTDAMLRYLGTSIHGGLEATNKNIVKYKDNRIKSYIQQGKDPKWATALVNQTAGGAFYDPYNAFDTQVTDTERQGVLSSASLPVDNGWMMQ